MKQTYFAMQATERITILFKCKDKYKLIPFKYIFIGPNENIIFHVPAVYLKRFKIRFIIADIFTPIYL